MPTIRAYHRPATLEDALALVSHADLDATLLAGGTTVNARPEDDPIDVVDLQGLGLDGITAAGDRLQIGAMTRLQELADSHLAPALLRELAMREAPSTLRNAGTVGGTVGSADPESELLAGLLAYEAEITVVHSIGSETMELERVLADRSQLGLGIITAITIAVDGDAASAAAARTPADRPIVLAVVRRRSDGSIRLALTGVAAAPVVIERAAVESLDPPGDFRGSPGYRRHLAGVLADRALARLGEGS